MQEIEREILERAAAGDVNAFEEVYKAYSRFVYNVALRMCRNNEIAQDVTQDVFITVYDKFDKFRFESSFKTWVYRITVNTSINTLKKGSKMRDKSVSFDDQYDYGQPADSLPEKIQREEQAALIDRLLGYLNTDQRTCIVLRNIEGLSYEEIAAALKIPINTVRSRLKRAREKLLQIRNEVIPNEV
ncbi:MAG: sigma-70 family RNA polymerase sigma factor [Candidatus Omnitrophica bacterium]|nr:sigma-70 family RNA polymerase sigma factor [Candidatus Omnitrophota bacterium]MCB9719287.1 sigma-70 family RNA polymerase sigma factor [Candidatus Omnitrophota bacterium]